MPLSTHEFVKVKSTMFTLPLTLLALAATALAAEPAPPKFTYLFSVNLTFAAPITIGSVPYGTRDLLTISGGTFSGPKLSGNTRIPPSPNPSSHNLTKLTPSSPATQAKSDPASTGA